MDPAVKIVKVDEVQAINPTTLAPAPQTRVTYNVGDHGPFTLVTPAEKFSEEYVYAETTKRVNQLRALGLVK